MNPVGVPALCGAFALSLLPAAANQFGWGGGTAGAAVAPLATLPWLALAGWPRRPVARCGAGARKRPAAQRDASADVAADAPVEAPAVGASPTRVGAASGDDRGRLGAAGDAARLLAALLPSLALAWGQDRRAGAGAHVLAGALWGAAFAALLTYAASRAASARRSSLYAAAWLVCVPGSAALAWAQWTASAGGAHSLSGAWLRAFPLAWVLERADALQAGGARPELTPVWGALALVLALVWIADASPRAEPQV